jgi:thiol-disulfide isomerase/thioredoxin
MQSARTTTYDAVLELRGGSSWRVVKGSVQLARFDPGDSSDPIGGRLAVRGEITSSSSAGKEEFRAVYNGEWMRRLRPQARVVLQGQSGFGGEELLRGSFGGLVLRELLAADPLSAERAAGDASVSGQDDVDGVPCDVVAIRLDQSQRNVEYFFGADDRLPRKVRQRYRSARGNEVESVLTLSNLQVNTDIDPAAFRIDTPEGYTLEVVGKKPPPPLNLGDVVTDWEITGSDGKTHKLSDYRGQLVVLDFWASWCPHCNRAMPAVQQMHDKYGPRGVQLFALNCRDRGDVNPVQYVRDKGFNYFVADGNTVAIQYRVGSLPAFYVIGPDGRLLYRESGYSPVKEQQLIRIIETHLADQGL